MRHEAAAIASHAVETADRPYRFIIDAMQQGAGLIGPDGTALYANRRLAEFLGVAPSALIGSRLGDKLAPGVAHDFDALLRQALSNPAQVQLLLPRQGRSPIPALVSCVALPGSDNRMLIVADLSEREARRALEREVIERRSVEIELRESEARFRALADNIASLAWMADAAGSIFWYNKRWFDYTGASLSEMEGWGWRKFHHPDHLKRVIAKFRRSLMTGEPWEDTFPLRSKDGAWRWFLSRALPIHDAAGRIVRWLGTNTDITELREAEMRVEAAQEVGKTGFFEWIAWEDRVHATGMLRRLLNAEPATGEVSFEQFAALAHPEDHARVIAAYHEAAAVRRDRLSYEFRVLPNGGERWLEVHSRLDYSPDGKLLKATGAAYDVTERKHDQERLALLLREVNHRAKNLLGVVQAIARHTAHGQSPEEFAQRFSERVQGLAACQDLLVRNEWRGVEIAGLVRSQLSHFTDLTGSRIELIGPPVTLAASAAQNIGMALHELGTNAGKYGALSNSEGRVRVEWSLEGEGATQRLTLCWSERAGPPVSPPSHKGFGHTVLVRALEQGLDAEVALDYAPAGLVWRLSCPATRALDEASAGGSLEPRIYAQPE